MFDPIDVLDRTRRGPVEWTSAVRRTALQVLPALHGPASPAAALVREGAEWRAVVDSGRDAEALIAAAEASIFAGPPGLSTFTRDDRPMVGLVVHAADASAVFVRATDGEARPDEVTCAVWRRFALLWARAAVDRAAGARDDAAVSDNALDLWLGFAMGRWAWMAEHRENERRLLVLHPEPSGRRLTPRQRQVLFYASTGASNKEIGFALGLRANTVSAHLERVLEHTRAPSRAALIHWSTMVAEANAAHIP